MKLNLTRPIVFFDLETTGTNVVNDRIVEICAFKVMPDGSTENKTRRINPGIPIPPEVTAIHGISDEDVKDCPSFASIAKGLDAFLDNCDLAGYNSNKFDIPMLVEEFLRCSIQFDIKSRKLVDVQNIFHKMEPRTLKAAYRFYCDKELVGAHGAEADTMATYEVLLSQIEKYQGVEYTDADGKTSQPIVNDMEALFKFSYNFRNADLVGHIGFNKEGKEILNFGKHKGKTLEEVFEKDLGYYDWIMKSDFPLSTKEVVKSLKFRGFNNAKVIFEKK